jgi:Cu+-exporting ATPase
MRQNFLGAFAHNVIGIPLAAGALSPKFGILLSPMIAAAAMSISSVSVVTNWVRLAVRPCSDPQAALRDCMRMRVHRRALGAAGSQWIRA